MSSKKRGSRQVFLFGERELRDTEFEALLDKMSQRPELCLPSPRLDVFIGYLFGVDDSHPHLLLGLWPVLLMRHRGYGLNLHWSTLLQRVIGWSSDGTSRSEADHKAAIRAAVKFIREYLQFRRKYGLTGIFYEFGKFLRRHKWEVGPETERRRTRSGR